MKKANHNGKVLKSYKKVGNKLIPPLMQLPIQETSFVNDTLPCLIWVSAIFSNVPHKKAVELVTTFIEKCEEILSGEDKLPPLVFMNNFDQLSIKQKSAIVKDFRDVESLDLICESIKHQYHLLDGYPLSFLFEDYDYGVDEEEALESLKEDVSSLLDRYTTFAVRVQTTAYYTMLVTKKIMISSNIDVPDFDAIFINPDSEESKRVGGFVRSGLNAGVGMRSIEDDKLGELNDAWAKDFWRQVYKLDGCL